MTATSETRAEALKDGGFVHLHTHTEYSMLDGAAKLDELFAEADRLGMQSLAITDHGYLFGAFDFWRQATAAGIKPIIGLEAYLTPGTQHRTDKEKIRWGEPHQRGDDVSGGGAYTHMTMWAENTTGRSGGQSESSSTNTAPLAFSPSTTKRLCTIS